MRSSSSGGKFRSDETEDSLSRESGISILGVASDEQKEVVLSERSGALGGTEAPAKSQRGNLSCLR